MLTPPLDARSFLKSSLILEHPVGHERFVLWLPIQPGREVDSWLRITAGSGNVVQSAEGLAMIGARTRSMHRADGLMQRFRRFWWPVADDDTSLMPDGTPVRPSDNPPEHVTLMWSSSESIPLDEEKIVNIYGRMTGDQRLGQNLYLLNRPVLRAAPKSWEDALNKPCKYANLADTVLESAKLDPDESKAIVAMADLGHALLKEGRFGEARTTLYDALYKSSSVGDRKAALLVTIDTGRLELSTKQYSEAERLFRRAADEARELGEKYSEILACKLIGVSYLKLGRPEDSIEHFSHAADLANEVGDRLHEAEIRWRLAIAFDGMARTREAELSAQESIRIRRDARDLKAEWFDTHLGEYRSNLNHGSFSTQPSSSAKKLLTTKSSPLQMAMNAGRAMSKFMIGGAIRTTAEVQNLRLNICNICEHHTGLRCKICGCFTILKAKMPEERCPIERWGPSPNPSDQSSRMEGDFQV